MDPYAFFAAVILSKSADDLRGTPIFTKHSLDPGESIQEKVRVYYQFPFRSKVVNRGAPMNFDRLGRFLFLTILAVAIAGGGTHLEPWGSAGETQQAAVSKYPKLILIIRHAEKTGVKEDVHLSEPGKERAKQLPLLFEKSAKRPEPLPRPDFIFAARDSKNSQRPRETVIELAKQFKLPIDDNYHSTTKDPKAKGAAELRDELFTNPKYAGKTILISWRHSALPELAKTLKATNAPTTWADEVFDRVWRITYDDAGKAEFVDLPQRLMPGDAVK